MDTNGDGAISKSERKAYQRMHKNKKGNPKMKDGSMTNDDSMNDGIMKKDDGMGKDSTMKQDGMPQDQNMQK
jgi:hypothetical protein